MDKELSKDAENASSANLTAVEWLFSELERMQYFIGNDMLEAYKQAKEMEKEQIISAFNNGEFFAIDYYHPGSPSVDGSENYYIETYGGEQ